MDLVQLLRAHVRQAELLGVIKKYHAHLSFVEQYYSPYALRTSFLRFSGINRYSAGSIVLEARP